MAAAHAWDPSVPVILVSGTAGEDLVVKALQSGATDYVLKRRLEALVPAVERALAEGAATRERIKLEADLEASQAAMRGSLDAMSDPFLICTAERDAAGTIVDFQVIFANRAAAAFMHRTQDAVIGAPMPRQMLQLRGVQLLDAFREVTETGQGWTEEGVEYTVPGPDGSTMRGLVDIQVANFGDGFFAVWREVTERERVHHEREQLAAALEQSSDGVLIVSPNGIVTFANPAIVSSQGLGLEDIVGREASVIAGGMLGPDGLADLLKASATGTAWSREIDSCGPDGVTHRIAISASPVLGATHATPSWIVIIPRCLRAGTRSNSPRGL